MPIPSSSIPRRENEVWAGIYQNEDAFGEHAKKFWTCPVPCRDPSWIGENIPGLPLRFRVRVRRKDGQLITRFDTDDIHY